MVISRDDDRNKRFFFKHLVTLMKLLAASGRGVKTEYNLTYTWGKPAASTYCFYNVSHNALVGFTGSPAMRTPTMPNVFLQLIGFF